ncbi:RtcB family protein [Bartonella sp. HY329]|uniref:RtcB family protein n=1 Tax=unclassified Bartonella TaxID=2645622 RepID=UPI0021C58D9A|nr:MULTISPECIES: RtcB family protein [unclassified Bartonella]UXM94958.1 RtcB family protein [Bartonella sp. HY329]UXN09281.1 RtcB family protein [Bartonella sp. HY328]
MLYDKRPLDTGEHIFSSIPYQAIIAQNEPQGHYMRALNDLQGVLDSQQLTDRNNAIANIVTTPDFHAGKPVPVGVVIDTQHVLMPHLIGNDIGCGMRMVVIDNVSPDELSPELDVHLRHILFQGGRNIALSGRNRQAILRHSILGLLDSFKAGRQGLLADINIAAAWHDANHQGDYGHFSANAIIDDFADYGKGFDEFRHDAILGTIGGGNHFVEFGFVSNIVDRQFAHAAGLKSNSLVIIIHSGSLDFGQRVGSILRDKMHKNTVHNNGFNVEDNSSLVQFCINGYANAINIAFANRFLIGLSAIKALQRVIKREVEHHLVYDVAHNGIWYEDGVYRHRKGACPARGGDIMAGSAYHWLGEPVILPGSMGDGSWLLKGLGNRQWSQSSAHGAGRHLSRSEARKTAPLNTKLRVVTPVAYATTHLCGRMDIQKELQDRLREEAPAAYRPIEDVVEPMVKAKMVEKVAKIKPILTVKG